MIPRLSKNTPIYFQRVATVLKRLPAFIISSLLTLSIIVVMGCSNTPTEQVLPAGSNVVALGDSLTYGYGATSENAYPNVLADLSNWQVANEGINGNTSRDVLARVDGVILQHPDLVLLGVGGNDVLQRVQPATTSENITAIINKLKAANIQVVLIAQPYFSASALLGKASDNPVYKDIAKAEKVPLYSDGWSKILSNDRLKSDQIHANPAGYQEFAKGLFVYLQNEGLAR